MEEWNGGFPDGGNAYGRRMLKRPILVMLSLLAGAVFGVYIGYAIIGGTPLSAARAGVVTVQVAAPSDIASPNAGQAGTIQAVAELAGPCVLEVTTDIKVTHPFWGSYVIGGAGSAVVLSEDGYLLTNNHVVADASAIKVRTVNGDEYPATLIGADSGTDIAVLRVEAVGLRPVTFADSDTARVGEVAIVIGNPLGTLGGTVTEGIISAKDRAINVDGDMMTLLQTSAAINPGNSGGGLFDGAGNLVGLVNMKSAGANIEGLGFAIPSNIVRQVAAELIEYGYVTGRPALGVTLRAITRFSDLTRFQLSEPGVYVMNALRDSPINLWDMIVSVNGTLVQSEADVKTATASAAAGDAVDVVVIRDGRTLTLTATLVEKTPEMVDAGMY